MPADTYTQKLTQESPRPMRLKTPRAPGEARLFRRLVIGLLTISVLTPICLIIYQSFLDGPFLARMRNWG